MKTAATIEDDDYDIDVLQDGARLRIPLVLMDSMQRNIAASTRAGVTDAFAAHKPGFRKATTRTIRDDIGGDELDVEARRHLKRMSDPKLSPYDRKQAAAALKLYFVQNYGDDEGAARYAYFAQGLNLDARAAAFAERGRYLKDAWRMPFRDAGVGPAAIQAHISGLHSMAADLKGKLDQEAADREEASEEKTRHQTDARDARESAYLARLSYLKDAYRQPFRDTDKLMQAGFHPAIAIGYGTGRDLRGPQAEAGTPDSESAYQASKVAASNAWRVPYSPTGIPTSAFAPMYERLDPQPGAHNAREAAEAKTRREIAEAAARKEKVTAVSREDYIRRTRTAWEPTAASAGRTNPKAATAIEKQAEGWRGGA
jgi:hypothetical protein